ncbi:MAG: hypothetical protein WCJ30_10450 [Deltaproteobacteria bacterium]
MVVTFNTCALFGAACAPGTWDRLMGVAHDVGPVVASLAGAYATTAKILAAPTAAPLDVQALADALAARDTCTVHASAALMPTATPDGSQALAAMRAQLAADERLIAALIAAHVDPVDGGVK